MTMPFGENYSHESVRLIDFDNLQNNHYQIVNQLHVRNRETKIPDIVLFINGIPVVVGEAKTRNPLIIVNNYYSTSCNICV
jgi:type I restriction enzyme R subunit